MRFANDFDILTYLNLYGGSPRLYEGAEVLQRLADWADRNSDGWAYWPKPVRAAQRLIELLDSHAHRARQGGATPDVTAAELTAAFRPIRSFLTRNGVNHEEVF